jgi:hypothetical protein
VTYATDDDLPDPPENPEFNELFTDAEQDAIALKFERGIAKHNLAMHALYARSAADNAARLERKAQVEARRARFLAGRFNPVLRSRP